MCRRRSCQHPLHCRRARVHQHRTSARVHTPPDDEQMRLVIEGIDSKPLFRDCMHAIKAAEPFVVSVVGAMTHRRINEEAIVLIKDALHAGRTPTCDIVHERIDSCWRCPDAASVVYPVVAPVRIRAGCYVLRYVVAALTHVWPQQ